MHHPTDEMTAAQSGQTTPAAPTSGSTTPTLTPPSSSTSSKTQLQEDRRGSETTMNSSSPSIEKQTSSPGEEADKGADKPIYIDWHSSKGDLTADHPWSWPERSKWFGLCVAILFNSSTAMNATGYSTTTDLGTKEFGLDDIEWLTGTTAYMVPVALAPLFLSPLSEVFGRRNLCLLTILIYTLMYLPQALAPNFASIIVGRIIQGIAGSVGNTMVGGFVADLWPKSKRAVPMSFFVLMVMTSQGVGSTACAWTVQNPRLGWRWIFWWQSAVALATFVLMCFCLPETRADVLLARKAAKLTKETGKLHLSENHDRHASMLQTIKHNCSRPVLFFVTEPIVTSLSLWGGFIWAVVFLSLRGVKYAFAPYGLSPATKSTTLLVYAAGGLLGFFSNLHAAHLYTTALRRNKARPETRLIWTMPAAVLTTVGLFWMGWTARESISIVVPLLGFVTFAWGNYIIYTSVLVYLADTFETYSSSAIACAALARNLSAGVLAVASDPLYQNLGVAWAHTLLGCLAALLGTAPFVLYVFGPKIRSKSRVCSQLARESEEKAGNGEKNQGA